MANTIFSIHLTVRVTNYYEVEVKSEIDSVNSYLLIPRHVPCSAPLYSDTTQNYIQEFVNP